MISLNQSEHDRLIETVLESINLQHENIERIDQEIETIRKERSELIFENDINLSVNKEK